MFEFKKKNRLLKKIEYDHVFAHANKIVMPGCIVLSRPNDLGHARLGLALSKKMIAKAHDRNRLKRLIRERFRQKQLPAVDVIFLAKKGVARQTNSGINTQLSKIWENLISYYDK